MLRTDLITIDPEITGGTPVFTGTRVPIETLFDYLAGGYPLAEFLEGFPSVTQAQAEAVLQLAVKALLPDYLRVQPAQIDFTALMKTHEVALQVWAQTRSEYRAANGLARQKEW